jgi:hypothetical protein
VSFAILCTPIYFSVPFTYFLFPKSRYKMNFDHKTKTTKPARDVRFNKDGSWIKDDNLYDSTAGQSIPICQLCNNTRSVRGSVDGGCVISWYACPQCNYGGCDRCFDRGPVTDCPDCRETVCSKCAGFGTVTDRFRQTIDCPKCAL